MIVNQSILENRTILENFILKLGFINERARMYRVNSVSISDIVFYGDISKIKGTVTMGGDKKISVITFETFLVESASNLIFDSEYQVISFGENQKPNYIGKGVYMAANQSNKLKSEDAFLVFEQVISSVINPKSKLLVHSSDGNIKQVYSVSSNYSFSKNGISDNFTLLSMSDWQIRDAVYKAMGVTSKRGK